MTRDAILVTGGAGFVGSHFVRIASEQGRRVIVLDDLWSGRASALPAEIEIVRGDIGDTELVRSLCVRAPVGAVVHFAGKIQVGESVRCPAIYFDVNLVRTLRLLEAIRAADVRTLIFSSTAAVYGAPAHVPIPESAACRPESPYGAGGGAPRRDTSRAARARDAPHPARARCRPWPPSSARCFWRRLCDDGWKMRSRLRACLRSCSRALLRSGPARSRMLRGHNQSSQWSRLLGPRGDRRCRTSHRHSDPSHDRSSPRGRSAGAHCRPVFGLRGSGLASPPQRPRTNSRRCASSAGQVRMNTGALVGIERRIPFA